MKKIMSVILVGLSFMSVVSFADLPPQGESCLAAFGPAPNADFCSCYAQQAAVNCTALHAAGVNCNGHPQALASQTCVNVQQRGGATKFCTIEVPQLARAGVTVTVQNCVDDISSICGNSGECNSFWN